MSAILELQHFLTQPPPSSNITKTNNNNPIQIAHAALQHLRDSGDTSFLFLRTIIELTSTSNNNNSNISDSDKEELLFHCVTGFRHVLLHQWNLYVDGAEDVGIEFCSICRDYFLALGLNSCVSSSSSPNSVSKTVGMASLNAAASFWKRSWAAGCKSSIKKRNINKQSALTDPQCKEKIVSIINMMNNDSSFLLQHRTQSRIDVLSYIGSILSSAGTGTHDLETQKSIMACSFLSTLVAEFSGSTKSTTSYYNLSVEKHRQLCLEFQESFGLDQTLEICMKSLGISVQALANNVTALQKQQIQLCTGLLALMGETLSWDFSSGGWNDSSKLYSSLSNTSIRPPVKWRNYIVHPDFLRALFALYTLPSITQQKGEPVNVAFKHSIRQAILVLASISGPIITEDMETTKGYAQFLAEGTLGILSTILPSIQSQNQDDGVEVVDMCSILTRLVCTFKLQLLSQLDNQVVFEQFIAAMSSVGCEILKHQLTECQRVGGDIEMILDDGWLWRQDAFNQILEGAVILAEDSFLFMGEGTAGDARANAVKGLLSTNLSVPLYTTYVSTCIQISHLEEYYLTTNSDDVDEIREQISEMNLEEQMEAVAALGRLNIMASVDCLFKIWSEISPQLRALFDSSSNLHDITPDAAALLEKSCILVTCLCHLLTDDNSGETPLIPAAIIEASKDKQTLLMIIEMIHSIKSLAEYHATKIVENPGNPNLSPFLGKTIVWFFRRWVSAYILPPFSTYNGEDTKYGILAVWSNSTSNFTENNVPHGLTTDAIITFCLNLCLHYYCYWPQEVQVQSNATDLLVTLYKRGKGCREKVINTLPFEQLVALNAVTASVWHSAPDTELEASVTKYSNICSNLSRNLIKGYQRISYESRAGILQALLGCCSDDNQRAHIFFECCLHSVQSSFANLIQLLGENSKHVQDIRAKDMVLLCVFLHLGIARTCEIPKSERISQFISSALPNLSGLMKYYAEDRSICECLLRLFRDYAEQFIVSLSPDHCLVLFQTSAELLKSYSTHHCAAREIHRGATSSSEENEEEEQKYSDVLCAIQLLIHLGTKDFIDVCDNTTATTANQSEVTTTRVTDIIFFGLQQIIPLMTQGLLHYPQLCTQYFSLVGFMMDTYPEKAAALPYDLFNSLLESLLFGMSHVDASIAKSSLRGISEVVKDHLKSGVLQNHLSQNPLLLLNACRRLLQEVIFQSLVFDRLEASGTALLPLVAVDLGQFISLVNEISGQFGSEEKQSRLQTAFERLIKPESIEKVLSSGYEGRLSRIKFKKEFELFVRDIHAFMVIL